MTYNAIPYKYLWMIPLLSAALTSCSDRDKNTAADTGMPVAVAHPEVRPVTLSRAYPGYLKADKTVQFTARVSGTLLHCSYRPGDLVHAGQQLFLIDPSTYEEQVAEAQATLRNAEANRDYTQASYERTRRAAQSDAVAQIQVLQTQAEYLQAVAQMEQAEAALRLAEISLGYCSISAPFAGHVTINAYDIGNYINAAENPALATLYKDDTLRVYFNVSENQYMQRQVRQLQEAKTAAAKPNEQTLATQLDEIPIEVPALRSEVGAYHLPAVTARLEYTAPDVTLSTGTLLLRAVLPNPDGLLRDGMYVMATLPYARLDSAVVIPDASVGHDQAGSYLYTLTPENVVERRSVTLGQIIDDTLRLVVSGVTPTDRFVLNAGLKVRPGMKVNPQNE
jgi:RND family efflux transporter MFP subunit